MLNRSINFFKREKNVLIHTTQIHTTQIIKSNNHEKL